MAAIRFRDDFPFWRLAWGKPDSPKRPICSLCAAGLPEVPLMMWAKNGSVVSLCNECVELWILSRTE